MTRSAKALIAEDEPHLAAHLRSRLKALWPELETVCVDNGEEALAYLEQERPDMAFLDIRMPGLTGLEVAERLSVPCRLVFVTAYDQYAIEAFERAAVDYLLKPVNDERLAKTIARLQETRKPVVDDTLAQLRQLLAASATSVAERLRWVRAQCGNAVRLVSVDEICYFQAADKYTLVVTADAQMLIRTSIKELQEQLDPDLFWQVHRGTLVNTRQIVAAKHEGLGRLVLKLRDRQETLPVSRSYAHLFRQM